MHELAKVMICGSRDGIAPKQIEAFVATLPPTVLVIEGGANGADWHAGLAAIQRGIAVKVVEPNWRPNGVYNPRAGFERNKVMVDEADCVVAFWNGFSRGTLDSIQHALRQEKLYAVYLPHDDIDLPSIRGVKWPR